MKNIDFSNMANNNSSNQLELKNIDLSESNNENYHNSLKLNSIENKLNLKLENRKDWIFRISLIAIIFIPIVMLLLPFCPKISSYLGANWHEFIAQEIGLLIVFLAFLKLNQTTWQDKHNNLSSEIKEVAPTLKLLKDICELIKN